MQISNKEGSMQKMVNLVATTVVVCSGIMLASGCEGNASQKAATIESEVLQLALVKIMEHPLKELTIQVKKFN